MAKIIKSNIRRNVCFLSVLAKSGGLVGWSQVYFVWNGLHLATVLRPHFVLSRATEF